MDPNANAVDAPVVNAAPANAAAPSAPVAESAAPIAAESPVATPVTNGLQLGEDIQKFLSNQNINSTDPNEIITTLVHRNQSLRSGKPVDNTDVMNVLSGNDKQVAPAPEPALSASPAPTSGKLSDIEIKTVEMLVQNQYKDVRADADFYREMVNSGFKPVSSDGSINLQNVLDYAKYKQTLSDAQKTIESARTAAVIPDPTNEVQPMSVPIQTMTEQAAQNIIIWSNQEKRYGRPVHSQYDEAVKFIQDAARNSR